MSITSTEIASRLRRPQRNNELLAGLLAGLLVLTACGGGGGGDTALSLTLTPQAIKDFQFSWNDVSGETEYRLMENSDCVSGFSQVATIPAGTNSFGLTVFLPARINAQYLLQACNAAGCSDSNTVAVSDSLASATGYIKASNTDSGGQFGIAASLSNDGNTLTVGANVESSRATGINGNQADYSYFNSGAVYVFARTGAIWSQQAYIKASNTNSNDGFGASVNLSSDGDTMTVGALLEDSNATGVDGDQADNTADGSGAVYLF